MTALWAQEAADRFWALAGGAPEQFPRDLEAATMTCLPVAVVHLPRLHVAGLNAWLTRRRVSMTLHTWDRPLQACLVVENGSGLIFLDGSDPEDERRFSVAHELAHFLIEYEQPTRQIVSRLGPEVWPVLEGRRPATVHERLDAVLANVRWPTRIHLMERRADGALLDARVTTAERDADALALELLAPVERVLAVLPADPASALETIELRFGLPRRVARVYLGQLTAVLGRHSNVNDAVARGLSRFGVQLGNTP